MGRQRKNPHEKTPEQFTSVYVLIDPRDGVIRYVGTSTDVPSRFASHIISGKKGESEKEKWINELLSLGMQPTVEVIYTCGLAKMALRLERLMMWKHRDTIVNGGKPEFDITIDPLLAQAMAECAIATLISQANDVLSKPENVSWEDWSKEITVSLIDISDVLQRHMLLALQQ